MTDLATILAALPFELGRRDRRDRAPEVFVVESEPRTRGLPAGSVSVVSGDEGSELVRAVRNAARQADAVTVADLLNAHERRLLGLRGRTRLSRGRPTVVKTMAALPAITQVSYRGKLIAEGLIVHGELEAMRVLIPYAGGTLDPEGFTASTYVVRGAEGPTVDTLVIVREPALTPLEQKVLRQLPRELSQLSLGRGDLASAPGIVAGLLMAEALEQRQRDLMQDQRDLMQEQELQRAQLDQLLRAQDLQRQLAQQELQRVQQAQQELQRAQLDQLLRAQDLQRQLGQLQQQQLLLQQQQQQQADDQRRQQQQADEQRRQEQQRQQQEAEQRQREAQEQQRQESEARQARAAEADAADGDDGDDDDGGRRVFFDEDVLAAEVEGLEPGAAVSRLVELRTRLMLAGRLR